MTEPIETIEREGFKALIYVDESPESPREDDNLGTMVTWHRRYNLGDEQPRIGFDEWLRNFAGELVKADDPDLIPDEDIERIIDKHAIMLKLGLYDHSGITMYIGGGPHAFDSAGWDSGTVGVICVTSEQIIAEYGSDTPETRQKAEDVLKSEVEAYDQYLTGDVYGYVIEDEDGNSGDSCWGFFGLKYAKEEAEEALGYAIKHEAEEAAKIQAAMHV